MDDVRAVLDAVGSSEAVLLAGQDGCGMAVLNAATGAALELAERGEHELKGVPGAWRLYALTR